MGRLMLGSPELRPGPLRQPALLAQKSGCGGQGPELPMARDRRGPGPGANGRASRHRPELLEGHGAGSSRKPSASGNGRSSASSASWKTRSARSACRRRSASGGGATARSARRSSARPSAGWGCPTRSPTADQTLRRGPGPRHSTGGRLNRAVSARPLSRVCPQAADTSGPSRAHLR
jgi:hypothetical protein